MHRRASAKSAPQTLFFDRVIINPRFTTTIIATHQHRPRAADIAAGYSNSLSDQSFRVYAKVYSVHSLRSVLGGGLDRGAGDKTQKN